MTKQYGAKLALGLTLLLLIAGCKSTAPTTLGLTSDGSLRDCPKSPNCVCTQDGEDEKHAIGPIYYESTFEQAKGKVIETLNKMKGTELITDSANYLHVEFTTKILSFVDDVEFRFDDERKTLHFRSASRVGYGDMGANRRRMEEFKELYYE